MLIRLGLPIPGGALAAGARVIGAPVLVSANALAVRDRDGEFVRFRTPRGLDGMDVFLDSAGFVAMVRYGAYPWTPEAYVSQLVASFPWACWSQLDLCCEPEVAEDRTTVRMRMAKTAQLYEECRTIAADLGIQAPVPILQGRTADDYEFALDLHPAFGYGPAPALVGIGSMCRRALRGPDGLLAVLERLDRVLPAGTRVHAFGVKGNSLGDLLREASLHARIASIDSCAWDVEARRRYPTGRTMARRVAIMHDWYHRHERIVREATAATQFGLAFDADTSAEDRMRERAVARLSLPHGSSGHPTDAPDALMEQYLDLVAGGEIEMETAHSWLQYDRAYGVEFGMAPDELDDYPDGATWEAERAANPPAPVLGPELPPMLGRGWVALDDGGPEYEYLDPAFFADADADAFVDTVLARAAAGTHVVRGYLSITSASRSIVAHWVDGAWTVWGAESEAVRWLVPSTERADRGQCLAQDWVRSKPAALTAGNEALEASPAGEDHETARRGWGPTAVAQADVADAEDAADVEDVQLAIPLLLPLAA